MRSAPKSWGEWGGVLSFCVESDEQAATGEDFGLLLPHAPHAQVHRMRLRWVLCRPQAFTNLLEAPAHLDLPRPGWLLTTCTVALALSPAPAPQSSPVRRKKGKRRKSAFHDGLQPLRHEGWARAPLLAFLMVMADHERLRGSSRVDGRAPMSRLLFFEPLSCQLLRFLCCLKNSNNRHQMHFGLIFLLLPYCGAGRFLCITQ